MLLLIFIALAVVVGYFKGGGTGNISQIRLRFGSLIIIALSVKVILLIQGYPFAISSPKLAIVAHTFS